MITSYMSNPNSPGTGNLPQVLRPRAAILAVGKGLAASPFASDILELAGRMHSSGRDGAQAS